MSDKEVKIGGTGCFFLLLLLIPFSIFGAWILAAFIDGIFGTNILDHLRTLKPQ